MHEKSRSTGPTIDIGTLKITFTVKRNNLSYRKLAERIKSGEVDYY